MLIFAGLDEAGYGPRLGPLVVSCTAFAVDERRWGASPDLWQALAGAVKHEAGGDPAQVWVADSKQIKPRKDGVRLLELGVLSFLSSVENGAVPTALPQLLAQVGIDPARIGASRPWYGGLAGQRLPSMAWPGEVVTRAARLREAGALAGASFLGAAARVLSEDQFNARVRETENKAAVLGEATVELLRALRSGWPGPPLSIVVDKHGGRDRYARLLGRAFPLCPIDPEAEGAELSAYRVGTPLGPVRVVFRPEAELHALPVALSSMLAKYLRELFMAQLNGWFQARVPKLKPTAGYAEDADRFLTDLEPELPRLGLTREALVRAR